MREASCSSSRRISTAAVAAEAATTVYQTLGSAQQLCPGAVREGLIYKCLLQVQQRRSEVVVDRINPEAATDWPDIALSSPYLVSFNTFLADRTATQYDRLLPAACCLSVCL